MTSMAVLTPSYAPDFELCADLNRSVLRHAPEDVEHHILVSRRDAALFSTLAGPRTRLQIAEDILPRTFLPVPGANYWINLRRPVPPIRGWIRQQILKLAAAAESDADVVVVADSDVAFVRPFSAGTFSRDRAVRFYRWSKAAHEGMPRHLLWHDVARKLLGLPPAPPPPLHDYVAPLVAFDPALLRQMLHRIEGVTGRPWTTAIGQQVHFSEFITYGVFVDELTDSPAIAFPSESSLCHEYWQEDPLDREAAGIFLAGVAPDDVAVMISAKSRTPLKVRRDALRQ